MVGHVLLLALAACLSGCVALRKAPLDYQRDASDTTRDPRGSWVVMDGANGERRQGELLAIHSDSLFIAGFKRFESFARSDVQALRVEAWNSNWMPYGAWAGGGLLSAFSHGFLSFASGPVWLTTFATVSATASGAGYTSIRPDGPLTYNLAARWNTATDYARFPAGLPHGVDRSMLRLVRSSGETIVVR